jgi:hypothetical protein
MQARLTIREQGPYALRLDKPHERRTPGQVLGCSGLVLSVLLAVNAPALWTWVVQARAPDLGHWMWFGMSLLLALMGLAVSFNAAGERRLWLLEARRETGRLVLGDRDGQYPPSEPAGIAFSAIRALVLEIPHGASAESGASGREDVPMDVEILGGAETPLHPRTRLRIDGVATRVAALDLLRRLARLVGLPQLHVLRNDPRDFRIRADADASSPGVAIDAGPQALAAARTPFDPAAPLPRPYRLREWAPGLRVRVDQGWNAFPLLLALAGVLVVGLLLWLRSWPGSPDYVLGAAKAGLVPVSGIALVVAVLGLRRAWPGYVLFDWTSGELVVQSRGRTRRLSLAEIERLELGEKIQVSRRTGDSPGGVHGHDYTVKACLAGGDELALLRAGNVLTAHSSDGRIRDYRALYPFVSHLADALRVPLRFGQ